MRRDIIEGGASMIRTWRWPRAALLRRMEIERKMIEKGYKRGDVEE